MSYAIRVDGLGWRAINGSDDVGDHEYFSETPVDILESALTPAKVTMRQARLALLQAGLLSQVEDAINALPEPARPAARIEWDFSSEIFRDRDFVIMLGNTLGLDSEEMDNLFITASTL